MKKIAIVIKMDILAGKNNKKCLSQKANKLKRKTKAAKLMHIFCTEEDSF